MKTKFTAPSADIVTKNISAIEAHRAAHDQSRPLDQKVIDGVARFLGSRSGLYCHFVAYVGCALFIFGEKAPAKLDERLTAFGTLASIEAIFLAIFVLINQKHMNSVEKRNADLHLQTSLLLENEVTKLSRTLEAIAKHLQLPGEAIAELREVTKDIAPQQILSNLSEKSNPKG